MVKLNDNEFRILKHILCTPDDLKKVLKSTDPLITINDIIRTTKIDRLNVDGDYEIANVVGNLMNMYGKSVDWNTNTKG